jgi:hypothetical protein
MTKRTQIKVKHRKLGREKADGLAWKDDGIIEIDPRLSAMDHLETALHESAHISLPSLTEKEITRLAKSQMSVLWGLGYRKVDVS